MPVSCVIWRMVRKKGVPERVGNSDERNFGLPDNLEKCYQDLAYIAGHCALLKTLDAGTNAKGFGGKNFPRFVLRAMTLT